MCKLLKIARQTYYYEPVVRKDETHLEENIRAIYDSSDSAYGAREIKQGLARQGLTVSRRKIVRITIKLGLISKYTVATFKPQPSEKVEDHKAKNELQQQFNGHMPLVAVVSDLTYMRVNGHWNYVCVIVDLFNREIIGFAAGIHKDAQLVCCAIASIRADLRQIQIFHSDRGREFVNGELDEIIATFSITRSLSKAGCPYDNAVAEATFKLVKTEFVRGNSFQSMTHLRAELKRYVQWFNNERFHSSLNYMTPTEVRQLSL